jgi:hypothetical protein
MESYFGVLQEIAPLELSSGSKKFYDLHSPLWALA